MRYNINFNQPRCMKYDLDVSEAAIDGFIQPAIILG